jgi:DNA-binding response OmpR family regulator
MSSALPATRILVVDDDRDTRESLKLILEAAGYRVATARDGSEALRLQEAHPADAVITDIFMPVAEGLETIKEIRSRFPPTTIIAVSGGGTAMRNPAYLETAGIAGADATLRKPVAPDELLAVLRKCLSHGRR